MIKNFFQKISAILADQHPCHNCKNINSSKCPMGSYKPCGAVSHETRVDLNYFCKNFS